MLKISHSHLTTQLLVIHSPKWIRLANFKIKLQNGELSHCSITKMTRCLVLLIVFSGVIAFASGVFEDGDCIQVVKSGVDWLLHAREPDYGWKEHTHRANIALAVVNYKAEDDLESRSMELQLEQELTKMMMRNDSTKIHQNDIALFVHALLARNKNPRDFHGIDLVADLLHRAATGPQPVHPLLVLALCNAGALTNKHLKTIESYLLNKDVESNHQTEMKALALQAYACADGESYDLKDIIKTAAASLISRQKEDGSFGNAYTSALVTQALIVSGTREKWNKRKALDFLKRESSAQVNMMKTYLIILAENAEKVKFVKELYEGPKEVSGPKKFERQMEDRSNMHFVYMSLYPSELLHFSLRQYVPKLWNAYEILESFSQTSDHFKFGHYLQKDQRFINSIYGLPNDAEKNLFWNLCLKRRLPNRRDYSQPAKYHQSPETLVPSNEDVISFYYGTSMSNCPN